MGLTMGVYLSQPITDKVSNDSQNSWLKCGVSSMQGWRATQEDAHNCCLDYDTDSSFFAVYDGHGGSEVAEYTAKHLPDFVKSVESYKTGDYEKALVDAFIDFDATLKQEAVIAELKAIAESRNYSDNEDKDEDDVDDVQELREEAKMPLTELIAKYTSGSQKASGLRRVSGESSGHPASPCLKAKTSGSDSEAGSSKDLTAGDPVVNGLSETNGEVESKEPGSGEEGDGEGKASGEGVAAVNGEHKEEEEVVEKKELQQDDMKKRIKSAIRVAKKKATVSMLAQLFEDASDSDSDNDESFHATDTSHVADDDDEEEDEEAEEGEEGEEEEEEEEESDEENESSLDKDGYTGSESGCTAVAALVCKRRLYVANAGDSRAVLCRNGMAVDLSVDHKPDDEREMARITAAGGKVTMDGRVNGGLNLSRAIGDHFYKKCDKVDARSQMITALPDVQVMDIDSSQDDFLVLACDGIWNSMSSQEVVDFIKPFIKSGEKLSVICEKLFEKCLAPDTLGDGTGCDNMTCIIVELIGAQSEAASGDSSPAPATGDKRSASPLLDDSNKRPKVESP